MHVVCLPFEIHDSFTPLHFRSILSECLNCCDPEMWPALYALQHDEKDIKRVRGALQDWGDGEAGRQYEQQRSAVDAAASALEEVRRLDADKVLTHAEFFVARYCRAHPIGSGSRGQHSQTTEKP